MMHSSIGIFYGYLFPPLRGNPWVSHGISTGLPRATHSFNSIAPKASPTDIRKVYVRLHSESSEPTMLLSQTTPDEHPPTPPPCLWPALITLPALAKFQLVWGRHCDAVLFPSYLFEHTLTAVCALPEYQSGRKYNVI